MEVSELRALSIGWGNKVVYKISHFTVYEVFLHKNDFYPLKLANHAVTNITAYVGGGADK